jgi:Tfp pilus assembly protein FimT
MGNHKRLTLIEIILILAIAAILVVWLFPRVLKTLDSDSAANGTVKSPPVVASEYAGPA